MNNDLKLIWEAYLAEDETTSTGEDIIDALEKDPEYRIQKDKRNEDIRMVVFAHVDKAITLEVLSKGETVAFVQTKWVTSDSEFPRNKDYGPDKIAKGPLTIMVDLEKIKEEAIGRILTDPGDPSYGTGPDDEPHFPWSN
tara:strand:- start:77 stop:496 length:420 start_codon:yes stop_codon:yes gene_type:complete